MLCEEDRSQWAVIFSELRDTLRHAARLCVRSGRIQEEALEKYFVSGKTVMVIYLMMHIRVGRKKSTPAPYHGFQFLLKPYAQHN